MRTPETLATAPPVVTPVELAREINRRAWYATNIVVWGILFVYPLFSILDYAFAESLWQVLLLVRLGSVVVFYLLYRTSQRRGWNYRVPLHGILALVSLTHALLINLVDYEAITGYVVTLAGIFLIFNAVVFWEAANSFLHVALVTLLFLLLYYASDQRYPLSVYVESGGQLFLIVTLFSSYIPHARFAVLQNEVLFRLTTQRTNLQLQGLNEEISEKNKVISEANQELQRLNEQKNHFIYIAGHDLKNLTANILTSASELKREARTLSLDQRDFVEFIDEAGRRIQYLLSRLLDVREAEKTALTFNYEVFDANRELDRVIYGLQEAASQKHIFLNENLAPYPISVKLDRVFTVQVFQNLVNNAIRFSQSHNALTLQTRQENSLFVFELTDPGRAIGPARLDELFQKLDVLSQNTVQETEDRVGLGLSIALRLTEAMQGRLTYRSDESVGNYYRLEFPSV
jgi:signal transduction histidine kinase